MSWVRASYLSSKSAWRGSLPLRFRFSEEVGYPDSMFEDHVFPMGSFLSDPGRKTRLGQGRIFLSAVSVYDVHAGYRVGRIAMDSQLFFGS